MNTYRLTTKDGQHIITFRVPKDAENILGWINKHIIPIPMVICKIGLKGTYLLHKAQMTPNGLNWKPIHQMKTT